MAAADAHGLDRVFLVAPSLDRRSACASTVAALPRLRLRRLASWASPAPATSGRRRGQRRSSPRAARGHRPAGLRRASASPTATQAAEVAAYADGVIVGSALVRCLLDAPTPAEGLTALRALTAELAAGVRAGR